MTVISLSRGDEFIVAHPLSGYSKKVIEPFDLNPEKVEQHAPFVLPELPETWGIGLIVGASGTGKSTLLSKFQTEDSSRLWKYSDTVLDVLERQKVSVEEASARLTAAGLNSVPTWVRPIKYLSTGERFRAELALSLCDGAVVDEYTSVVSRPVAISASMSVRKWVNRSGVQRIVFASCHYDIVEPLQPDWIINTDEGIWTDDFSWKPTDWYKSKILDKEAGTVGWK